MAQEVDEVAHPGKAQPHHQRVLRGVDELVDPAGPEAFRKVTTRGRRHDVAGGIGGGELPVARGDGLPGVLLQPPAGEGGCFGVQVHGWTGPDVVVSAQGHGGDTGLLDDELGSKRTRDGAVRSCGDGQLHGQASVPRKQISLPPAPHHGVAPAHQKAVARVLGGARIVGGRGIVEELQRALVAAVVDVVEQPPVAAAHVHGLDDEELRGILHQAAVVGGRQRQVHDVLVGRQARVDGEPHPSLDPFVGADRAEVGSFGKGCAFLDDQGGVHKRPRGVHRPTARREHGRV